MIFDLGACTDRDSKLRREIWLEMVKDGISESLKGSRLFDMGNRSLTLKVEASLYCKI